VMLGSKGTLECNAYGLNLQIHFGIQNRIIE